MSSRQTQSLGLFQKNLKGCVCVCVYVCVCGCVCVGGISEDDRMWNTQGFCENCQIALEIQGRGSIKKMWTFQGRSGKSHLEFLLWNLQRL